MKQLFSNIFTREKSGKISYKTKWDNSSFLSHTVTSITAPVTMKIISTIEIDTKLKRKASTLAAVS